MKTRKKAALAANDIANSAPTVPPPHSPSGSASATVTACLTGGANTIIDIKLDVGFGNAVFLRGNGGGLTWERGVPLACVDGKTWRWIGMVQCPVIFKPLINDQIWSAGDDMTVKPGQKLEIKPIFR
jgi:hypothetical protein